MLLNRIFATCIFLVCSILSHAQLTIIATIPATTPKEPVFIAGNFNNWNPGNQSYKLSAQGNDIYTITFTPPAGNIEYKFTRGSWATVEGTASGGFIPNRTYHYTGGPDTIHVTIAGWEDGPLHTATENVFIVDEAFFIPELNRNRRIWIYLPPDYSTSGKDYPVIYMHDGQNLFDAFYSFSGEWKIDESMDALFVEGDPGAIVVGIENGGTERINEYSAWINQGYGGGDGELYAQFIVNTLKPYIDTNYRTKPQREFTAIAGSSLGANISIYTAIEYQETFGKAGIFSPAFWFSDSIYLHVEEEGIREDMRIYFVAGDNESATMLSRINEMVATLVDEGMDEDDILFIHHADGAHSEWYWAREYSAVYEWLFDETTYVQKPMRIVRHFIYPNPADKLIRIQNESLNIPYTIYSPVGSVIRSARAVHDSIDISFLPAGLYYLEIGGEGNEYWITRFIKK